MKAPNGPLILIAFCALTVAICWFVITALTTPARAITSGIVVAAATGLFIWFAATDRFAIARGVISVGVTAVAAPLAGLQAITNDVLFSVFSEEDATRVSLEQMDTAMALGWIMSAWGAGIGLTLIIIGGVMHRTPRPQD